MVCKEEILTWFKDLDSYKRIDMLCELINMCIPFELRFVGSYIEEMGKHSYQELRQQALAANDLDKLDKDVTLKNQTLYDENIRHRMLINVSLLKSRNYNVANWYSKKFLRTDYIEDLVGKEKDEAVQNELLLLYTMATRHPAFNFEQKQFFSRVLVHLYELRENRFNKLYCNRYPPGFELPNAYRNNMKVHDNSPFPMGYPIYPPGLPPQFDFPGQYRTGWPPVMTCGAPAEVPPFPQPPPLQPPQPSTSPLISSPNQSRSSSPRPVSRPLPAFSLLTSGTSTVTLPTMNPSNIVAAAGIPAAITTPMVMSTPVASVMPIMPVPMGQSSQCSSVYCKSQENDEANTTLKVEDSSNSSTSSSKTLNSWLGPEGGKQINGMRITPYAAISTPATVRTSIADQIQAMALNEEGTHYHSSSSSSPLQTPPDTPSNLVPVVSANTSTPHRSALEKSRLNGMPPFISPFPGGGDTTSPPPSNAFTFPAAFAPMPRFFANANFRPPVTSTVFGQFAPPQPPTQAQPFQQQQQQPPPPGGSSDNNPVVTPSYQYSIPYLSLLYSSFPPLPPPAASAAPPTRNQPSGCYNCGAPGHLGQDCPQHNIDEITQKHTYSVDFSPVNSDSEK